ncbi:hypothetical protein [Ilyobacter polytropus]|uniref:Uncharacterized protein n=1 Tax=Ilyobacter polytropus (strain ATCC 51220 / DSM 2926 / LMG 16218 / CuHBu1) TaxID=572544 RepID=E3H9F3_ILYPC|nr:hypothetical protein [Ilyobacter polytropus]ADO83062.1 hypothetical protein Ilyop_1281 [Ilyobacter polytropus DSM 2926]
MKKIIGILAIIISTTAFSKNQPVNYSVHKNAGKSQIAKKVSDLKPGQQRQYKVMHERAMDNKKKHKMAIKEIDNQIQKERRNKKPNIKKIKKLNAKKSRLQDDQERSMLKFKLEVKDKFGIKIASSI